MNAAMLDVPAAPLTLLTAEEFAAFIRRPENQHRQFELERGRVVEITSPARPHGLVVARLVQRFAAYIDQRGFGEVCTNGTGFLLEADPPTIRFLDVFVYDQAITHQPASELFTTPPVLAVDVLAPGEGSFGRQARRVVDFLKHGVRVAWVVDTEVRNMVVYRAGQPPMLLEETDEILGDPELPGFRATVAEWFGLPGGAATVSSPAS
jgi:Uma2 family endonuclease